jgi:asparagine synthase (glutamine-hydrolysing)
MQKLVQYIKETVVSERALDRGFFQKSYLENILQEHIQGKQNHRLLIWSLLSFEWWNRIFIDNEEIEQMKESPHDIKGRRTNKSL